MYKEAYFYNRLKDNKIICTLCPHLCKFDKNHNIGFCKIRILKDDKLYLTTYGNITPPVIDPIEKKPLYHFFPGSGILSIGSPGCNMDCPFCQNWHLSKAHIDSEFKVPPQQLVEVALKENSIGIAYTYSEPFAWYEYVYDTAILAKKAGLKNVLVTNGMINIPPLKKLLPLIDAANIDFKSSNKNTYKNVLKGNLDTAYNTIKTMFKEGIHIEVTHLVVTGINDDIGEFKLLCEMIRDISTDIPLHISRYFPNYKWNYPPTDLNILEKFYKTATQYLNYVYLGNVPSDITSTTFCKHCKKPIITRSYYAIINIELDKKGKCIHCGGDNNIILS